MLKYFFIVIFSLFPILGCSITLKDIPVQSSLSNQNRLIDASGKETAITILEGFRDSQQPKPTIIVAHGSGGVTPVERRLSALVSSWDFNAVVVDHYRARNIQRHTGRIAAGATPFDRANDLTAVINWVKQQPWHQGKIGILGISQGAGGVWHLAASSTKFVDAAVVMYPGCAPSFASPPSRPAFPIQMHLAGADDLVPIHFCQNHGSKLYETYLYPGATHSFNLRARGEIREFTHRYDEEADLLSQDRMQRFFNEKLK
jgi:dienelactone hydrolase